MRVTMMMAACLMLAACGSSETGNNTADSETEQPAVPEQTPVELTEDTQNQMVPIETPAPVAAAAIPAAFRGRWGMVGEDCEAGRSDAKGLMTVGSDTLGFYESRATAGNLKIVGPDSLTADLAFTGEGQTWERGTTLTLVDDGKTLVRTEQKPAGSFRYTKCPA